ncbi:MULTISPECIES: hypothetical protein [Cytophagales]|uniref:Uncharacterized protein n=1 Tax=Solirubrum puertoriconensis TaxID=1751427 RepID=A0A9X0HLW8_SOLP1|nr:MULTISPECIES: hypothetical protein [Cytophagales]KUG08428.1 hypothetical protein ASU33_09685 [Solirubrum puertoriconensis]UYZ59603.1 hypothetical protein OIS50_02120 [Hymenobacter sp. YIM 151858-1]
MDTNALNKALAALLKKKHELHQLAYSDARYDDVEEELHDLEDDFNEEYGEFLEAALEKVHGELGSDTDVLLPTAYLPNGPEPTAEDGVWIDSEKYPGKVRLVLLPSPTRLVLNTSKGQQHELWKA